MSNTSKEVQFWEWFAQHQEALYLADENALELLQLLNQELGKVCPDLTFELSTAADEVTKILCISADGMKVHFPAVIDLVKEAPSFQNWTIRAFRQRIPNDGIAIALGDLELSYDDLYFLYNDDYDTINIEIHARGYEDSNTFISAIFVLLDALLGEYDVATQISTIEWKELDEDNIPHLSPFVLLRGLIDLHKARKN